MDPRTLDDPRTMRALAHPLRLRLLELLTVRGPMTATGCSDVVDESPASCSFHLRMLAKYGFVEEAAGGTGRSRPWQVTSVGNRWRTGPDVPPATRAAGELLAAEIRRRDQDALAAYLDRSDEFGPEWHDAVVHSQWSSYLTPAELAEINATLLAIWEPYLERLTDPAARPPGSALVHMFAHGFPKAEGLDEPAT